MEILIMIIVFLVAVVSIVATNIAAKKAKELRKNAVVKVEVKESKTEYKSKSMIVFSLPYHTQEDSRDIHISTPVYR